MADTISVKEAAARWQLAVRTVTGFCRDGKIPGAVRNGREWKIPASACRPADNRRKKSGAVARRERLPLPVGVSDYRLASTEYYYIDKTMLLKDFLDERPAVTLFTRPRRFGKTLTMDMLRTFFEKTEEDTTRYFVHRAIWQQGEKYRAYQGKYPVIFITLKDVKHRTMADTLEAVRSVIACEYMRHKELENSPLLNTADREFYARIIAGKTTAVALEQSLFRLSAMLKTQHGERAVIIVDEYDTPIQSGYTNGFYEDVIGFMRNLLSGGFKDNPNLAFGFLTGILRVARESIFSGLNNLNIQSVLDSKYSEYFGFTAEEVRQMAEYYGVPEKFAEICEWYDGYRFGKTEIYNPWSVVNYFSNGCEPRAFWLYTGSNEIIGEILRAADDGIYEKLTSLVNGQSFTTYIDTSVIYPQIRSNPSSVYSFLLVSGYLKAVKSFVSVNGDFLCEVALPNQEISFVYRKEILQQLQTVIPHTTAVAVEEALFAGDGEKFRDAVGQFLIQSVSSFDTVNENFYHGFMLGICTLFGSFYVTSNREAGIGRYDIQLAPKKDTFPGIILELKAGKDCTEKELQSLAVTALQQIKEKKYSAEMRTHCVGKIYQFGVAFSGKQVQVEVGEE